MSRGQQRLAVMLALLATTLAALLLMLVRGTSCGHDLDFHLLSWFDVARAWRSGLLTPHWAASANYGAGEPRLMFYPPGSWMLGGVIDAVAGERAAPLLFTASCMAGAGAAMYGLARRWLFPLAAGCAGCLAIANPYMLFVAYERTAYGELLAAVLAPLALAYAVAARPRVAGVALVVAGMWLSNAPAGLMSCYALLLIALLRLVMERSWQAGLRLGGGAVLGMGLAGIYLVPAAWEQRWVEIARVVGPGMRVEESFLFGHTGEQYHDAVLHTASWIACVLMVALLAGALWWREVRANERGLRQMALLAAVLFLLMVPVSAPVWQHLPRLAYVQFSWRWLMFVGPIAVLLLTGAMASRLPGMWMVTAAAGLCALSITVGSRHFYQWCDADDTVRAQAARLASGTGEAGTDEYTPRDVDNSEVAQQMPQVRVLQAADAEIPESRPDTATDTDTNPEWQRDVEAELPAEVHVRQWGAEHRDLVIESPSPGYAVLRLTDYHDWAVTEDGQAVVARPHREDGLMTIPIRAGATHIEIHWRTTRDVWAGRGLTLLAMVVWVGVWSRERRAAATA